MQLVAFSIPGRRTTGRPHPFELRRRVCRTAAGHGDGLLRTGGTHVRDAVLPRHQSERVHASPGGAVRGQVVLARSLRGSDELLAPALLRHQDARLCQAIVPVGELDASADVFPVWPRKAAIRRWLATARISTQASRPLVAGILPSGLKAAS
ncbi:hypothetical protein SACE_4752 [Saccharopolyspora erythraea NRRL 2338]|uniref:Uncharacterized protein n=1 Tax=Saccharopolyspora erythraea (strain ATCC 11635 / DSM 40517 / JCM 4748 / NBRC 13426 / NCIMB 8594 / NRRL 2338) TaxID=405948 RepID=A4FIZ5_SACEN|nr:hypothetical protein SACE_4752 [Saccharopolyspora erythraea NRRL 2338]